MGARYPLRAAGWGLATLLLVGACAPTATPAASSKPASSAPAVPAGNANAPSATSASVATGAPAAAPTPASVAGAAPTAAQAALPTTPRVALKMGTSPVSAYGPFFIAQERGYFSELGLDV